MADHKTEYASFLAPRQQRMPCFAAKCLKIRDRRTVGCQHAQALPRRHAPQCAVRLQHGQRAVHAFDVKQGFTHAGKMRMTGPLGKRAEHAPASRARGNQMNIRFRKAEYMGRLYILSRFRHGPHLAQVAMTGQKIATSACLSVETSKFGKRYE